LLPKPQNPISIYILFIDKYLLNIKFNTSNMYAQISLQGLRKPIVADHSKNYLSQSIV